MSARFTALRTFVAGCALAVALACLPASAPAATTHPFVSSFGAFASVQGVAVDQSSGDVYVLDAGQGGGSLFKFDGEGNPAQFEGLPGEPVVIEGVGGAGGSENELAVDNSAQATKGDVYVAANNGAIKIFGADGKALGVIGEEAPAPWGEACGVAVDPSGNVYVGIFGGDINKYANANPVTSGDYVSSIAGADSPCNIAVDSEGSVFSDKWSEGPVTKYPASQFGSLTASGTVVDTKGSTLAVNPATDEVYVDEQTQISQFGPHGEPFEAPVNTFASSGEGAISGSLGIAVNGTSGDIYASDGKGHISVFGPLATLPEVTTGPNSNVTTNSATVTGTVNPEGVAITTCEFEYVTNGYYVSHLFTYNHSVPCASNPGNGSAPVEVTADLSGLEPNVEYHYRLVAGNTAGSAHGADKAFLTLNAPVVRREFSGNIGVTSATLNATLNPMYFDTTYHFEYGTSTSYGTTAPVPDGDIGSGSGHHVDDEESDITVSQPLTGLQAATTYHYRVVATNANGTTEGPDHTFSTWPAPGPAEAENCPNAAYRVGTPSAALPDCRAYEMVSPVDKNGSDIEGDYGWHTGLAAASGNRVAFTSHVGIGDTTGSGIGGGTQYVATRGSAGWSARGVTPTPASGLPQIFLGATRPDAFSTELDEELVEAYDLPGLGNDAPGALNIYLENTEDQLLETISTPLGSTKVGFVDLEGATHGYSSDLGVVALETPDSMLPQTDGNSNEKLYVWEHGTLNLAGVLPDGSIPLGGSASPVRRATYFNLSHSVSSDGSRVFFVSPTDGSSLPQLYMRKDGSSTVWVSESEASTPDLEPQHVVFETASPDGKKVLFTTSDRLTDADPGGAQLGLYMYTDGPHPESESNLTFIARINSNGDDKPEELVPGIGESDGHTRIYFMSGPAPGFPVEGTYLWDDGTIHFVAAETFRIRGQSNFKIFEPEWDVSSDGEHFAFTTNRKQLTNEDTGPTHRGSEGEVHNHFQAMYVYAEPNETLRCVSCPSNGAAMASDVQMAPYATQPAVKLGYNFSQRFMSDDGRYVFFSTADALVPQDTNGLYDVYEYDASTGKVSLLSPGTGDSSVWFFDASSNGDDAFLMTREHLVSKDRDTLVDLYDARVNGGFPEPPPPPPACVGDACQGVPSAAPVFSTASGLTGLGNGAGRQAAKPVKKKPGLKHRHKRKRKQGHGQAKKSGKSVHRRARR
jgi:hypothetical protein